MKTPCNKCGGDTYLCQVCGEVRCDCTHHSTWVVGLGNVCSECLPPEQRGGMTLEDDIIFDPNISQTGLKLEQYRDLFES